MDVKLQIEVAQKIVSYHGKPVFVRMIKKKGEYIASVEVKHSQRNRAAGGDGVGGVKEEHASVAVDGLVPIGLERGVRNPKKKTD